MGGKVGRWRMGWEVGWWRGARFSPGQPVLGPRETHPRPLASPVFLLQAAAATTPARLPCAPLPSFPWHLLLSLLALAGRVRAGKTRLWRTRSRPPFACELC
ncbi:hypothetical protein PVAP13_7KG009173 [Panicum virgatum]|uniref:Uncharacterized protein n=1 Tax=Panicum virgatum TaxID=38727 RepID=A0A8T0QBY8_PANVG|nr:hypothetical protein PVAP13_7KG009173 [Panicum virgatum]